MKIQKILISLVLIIFILTPCHFSEATPLTTPSISIYSYDKLDQPIIFPAYLKWQSPVIERMINSKFKEAREKKIIFRSIHSNVLRELKECVDLLTKAARNNDGEPVAPEKINKNTIFVHSLLEEALYKKLNKVESFKLKQLFQATHFLMMDRLLDAFSYIIAKRIHTKVYTNTSMSQLEFDQYMQIQWGWITEEQYQYIREHLYLIRLGKQKQTIADYIGLYGQPYCNQRIDLKKTGLTSLQGVELLRGADKTTTLLLNDNCIIDASLDPNFPQKPFRYFRNLACLYLSGNQLSELSEDFFHNLPLKWLYLNNNQLKSIHKNMLQGQQHLNTLSLSYNQLREVPEELFSSSPQIENFFVSHNFITRLPKLFHGCHRLRYISLAANCLVEFPEDVFMYQSQLKSLNLCENPTMTLSPNLFGSLKQLQHLFLEETQKDKLSEEQRRDLRNVVIPTFCPDER